MQPRLTITGRSPSLAVSHDTMNSLPTPTGEEKT